MIKVLNGRLAASAIQAAAYMVDLLKLYFIVTRVACDNQLAVSFLLRRLPPVPALTFRVSGPQTLETDGCKII